MVSTAPGPLAARDRAVRHLPDRDVDARPAGPGADALGDEVRHLRRHAGVPRRRGHLLRAAGRARAAGRHQDADCPRASSPSPARWRRRWARSTSTRSSAGGTARRGRPRPRRRRSRSSRACGRIQDWVVTPLLKSVPGVTEVNSFGGYLQQYQVIVDPGPAAEVRPAGRGGARGHPDEQLERRRQHRRAAVRAVHHPRASASSGRRTTSGRSC